VSERGKKLFIVESLVEVVPSDYLAIFHFLTLHVNIVYEGVGDVCVVN